MQQPCAVCVRLLPLCVSFTPPPSLGCMHARVCVQEEEKKAGGASAEHIEKPDHESTARMKHGTYDKIDNDGLVPPGAPHRARQVPSAAWPCLPACLGPCQ